MNFIQQRLQRLDTLQKERPQYAEIFAFYRQLFLFLEKQGEIFLTVRPGGHNKELRRSEGFPLLSGDDLEVDRPRSRRFLEKLIDLLREQGQQGEQELLAMKEALVGDRLDLQGLFSACLERNRQALHNGALAAGVPPALLEYVFDTALSYALQRAREEGMGAESEDWSFGHCPLCGGLPAMGELAGEEGQKVLHCASCATSWAHPRLKCSCCGNTEPDSQEYFTAEGDRDYRVNVCRKCSGYLKVVDNREPGSTLPMDVEDVGTLHLDLLAQKEGFTRGKKSVRSEE